jgi:hypothetical protein
MKKLNNKGITTIEVLLCFVLVVIITVSIYSTVSSFNDKKVLEGYREEIINYKNLLTKDIQDDFIKIGVSHARYEVTSETLIDVDDADDPNDPENRSVRTIHTLYCDMMDGTQRKLVVEQLYAESQYHYGGSKKRDDEFMIRYGTPEDMIDWELPDVGHSGYDWDERTVCDVDAPNRSSTCRMIQDFSINNVMINITEDNAMAIYIGFYHPEFGNRYAINIVAPINYVSSGYDSSTSWSY